MVPSVTANKQAANQGYCVGEIVLYLCCNNHVWTMPTIEQKEGAGRGGGGGKSRLDLGEGVRRV